MWSNNIKKLLSVSALSFLCIAVTPVVFAETIEKPGKNHKVTLSSLLAETIEATQETQTVFDQQETDEPSSNIAFPPVIDTSYADVVIGID